MFFYEQGMWDTLFGGAPVVVSQPFADVAHPGSPHFAHTSRTDKLIEEHIRDGADQRQVAPLLANEFMPGGKRDERLQRQPQRDRCSIWHKAFDSLTHRH